MPVGLKPILAPDWLRVKLPAGAHFKKINMISGLVTKIMKAPAASAGPVNSSNGLRFLVTSPEGNSRGRRGYHVGMGPQLAV